MRVFTTALLAVCCAAGATAVTRSDFIEVTAAGTMRGFDLPYGDLPTPWDEIELDDPFVYVFIYDSTTADSNPDPQRGDYLGAIVSGSVTIDGVTAWTTGGDIEIRNDLHSDPADWQNTRVGVSPGQIIETQLFDHSGSVFTTDELATLLDLTNFPPITSRRFEIGTGGNVWVGGITTLTYEVVPAPCLPDLGGDGLVGFGDLSILLAAWGECSGCREDLDGDDRVGFNDLVRLLGAWGQCP